MGKNFMMNNFTFNTLALTLGSIIMLSVCIALNIEVIISIISIINIIMLALIIISELNKINIRLRSNGEVNHKFISTIRREMMVL